MPSTRSTRKSASTRSLGGITETLSSLGLPLRTEIAAEELIKSLALDKKRGGAGMRLVVPEELGRCRILEMSLEEASDWLRDGI